MNPELKQKTETIKKAVLMIYINCLPFQFSLSLLIRMVRYKMDKNITDCTITRRLRELRSEGKIDYKVTDRINGIYEKII